MKLSPLRLSFLVAAAACWAPIQDSQAALLIYEPFDYSSTQGSDINHDNRIDLHGMGGGSGFGLSGTWTEIDFGSLEATPLDYIQTGAIVPPLGSAALPPSGNFLHVIEQMPNPDAPGTFLGQIPSAAYRDFSLPIAGAADSTIWISFLVRRDVLGYTNGERVSDSFLLRFSTAGGIDDGTTQFEIGRRPTNLNYGIWGLIDSSTSSGADDYSDIPAAGDGVPVFLVAKISFGIAGDKLELFVNPSPSVEGPSNPDASLENLNLSNINRVTYEQGGRPRQEWSLDELRIGEQWSDVAAVPEPSSLLLTGIGALIFGGARLRRSRVGLS